MKFVYDIIKKPVITERSMEGIQDNKYNKKYNCMVMCHLTPCLDPS